MDFLMFLLIGLLIYHSLKRSLLYSELKFSNNLFRNKIARRKLYIYVKLLRFILNDRLIYYLYKVYCCVDINKKILDSQLFVYIDCMFKNIHCATVTHNHAIFKQ